MIYVNAIVDPRQIGKDFGRHVANKGSGYFHILCADIGNPIAGTGQDDVAGAARRRRGRPDAFDARVSFAPREEKFWWILRTQQDSKTARLTEANQLSKICPAHGTRNALHIHARRP